MREPGVLACPRGAAAPRGSRPAPLRALQRHLAAGGLDVPRAAQDTDPERADLQPGRCRDRRLRRGSRLGLVPVVHGRAGGARGALEVRAGGVRGRSAAGALRPSVRAHSLADGARVRGAVRAKTTSDQARLAQARVQDGVDQLTVLQDAAPEHRLANEPALFQHAHRGGIPFEHRRFEARDIEILEDVVRGRARRGAHDAATPVGLG